MKKLKVLSLNCQRQFNPKLGAFLQRTIRKKQYDFLLLQEASKEVLTHIANDPAYTYITPNDENGNQSQVSIVYKTKHALRNHSFVPLPSVNQLADMKEKVCTNAFVVGTFSVGKRLFHIAGAHTSDGFSPTMRFAGLQKIQQHLQRLPKAPTIIGGDFNTCTPYELERSESYFGARLVCVTKKIRETFDSSYSEPALHKRTYLLALLTWLGIRFRLALDHFFIDQETHRRMRVRVRVLKNRVSDHLPVALTLRIR